MIITGTRVAFRLGGRSSLLAGTAIVCSEVKEELGCPSAVLVYTDVPLPEAKYFPRFVGGNRGLAFDNKELSVHTVDASWRGAPSNLTVFVKEAFTRDGIGFLEGAKGRPVEGCPGYTNSLLVSWDISTPDLFRFGGHTFYNQLDEETGKTTNNCFNVDTFHLGWGIKTDDGRFIKWPDGGGNFKPGDIIRYICEDPTPIPINRRMAKLYSGAILRYIDGNGSVFVAEIIAGAEPSLIGQQGRFNNNHVESYEEAVFLKGNVVEVGASLDFKGRDLRGVRGKVILPTDTDDDVGVEFDKDIRAGSLDGKGISGRCLYVPSKLLKKLSG